MAEKLMDEMNYNEFVDWRTRVAHDSLLQDGSKGLRQAIFDTGWMWLQIKEAQLKKAYNTDSKKTKVR